MKNREIYKQIRDSIDFLEADKHDDRFVDFKGDPIDPVSIETFNKYVSFILHIMKSCPPDLPLHINLCSDQTIDIEFTSISIAIKTRLLINISENRIGWYGYSGMSIDRRKNLNEIKGDSTSEIPDYNLVQWINKYF